MNYSWVVVGWCGLTIEESIKQSSYFTVSRNTGFLKPVGIADGRAYRPWLVEPGIEVWQEINKSINRGGLGHAAGRSSRLTLTSPDSIESRDYTFVLRLYRPGTLVIEVNLKQDADGSIEEAFFQRDIRHHKLAYHVVDCLFGMVSSGDINSYRKGNSFSTKAAMQIPVDVDVSKFDDWVETNKSQIVGLLINNKNYEYAEGSLVESVIRRSKELDVKFAKIVFSIVSKQGLLICFPREGNASLNDVEREFTRRLRFLEYALVLQLFSDKYILIRNHNRKKADFLLFLCLPYFSEDLNIPKSVTGTNTWSVLASEFNLKSALSQIDPFYTKTIIANTSSYMKGDINQFDSLNYLDHIRDNGAVLEAVLRDFSGPKIIGFVVTSLLAIAGFLFKWK